MIRDDSPDIHGTNGNTPAANILSSDAWALTIRAMTNTIRPSYSFHAAIIPEHLLNMMEDCDRHDEMLVLGVALTFGFFAYLRISNLAPPKAADFNDQSPS